MNQNRTILIVGGILLLVLLSIFYASTPAHATDSNQADFWVSEPGEQCTKPAFSSEDSTTDPFTLPDLPVGAQWSKVIVKAGSTGHSVVDENYVYLPPFTVGQTFVHPEKDSISHVVYCWVPKPTPTESATPTPTPTPTVEVPDECGFLPDPPLTVTPNPDCLVCAEDEEAQPTEGGYVCGPADVPTPHETDGPKLADTGFEFDVLAVLAVGSALLLIGFALRKGGK